MDPAVIETLQGVVQQSVDAMKAALRESEVKVQTALQATLQENEANVQKTIRAANDRIDARFRNQQRHHDEDMRALYDQMTTFQRGGDDRFRIPGQTLLPSGTERRPREVQGTHLKAKHQLQPIWEQVNVPAGPRERTNIADAQKNQRMIVTTEPKITIVCRSRRSRLLRSGTS